MNSSGPKRRIINLVGMVALYGAFGAGLQPLAKSALVHGHTFEHPILPDVIETALDVGVQNPRCRVGLGQRVEAGCRGVGAAAIERFDAAPQPVGISRLDWPERVREGSPLRISGNVAGVDRGRVDLVQQMGRPPDQQMAHARGDAEIGHHDRPPPVRAFAPGNPGGWPVPCSAPPARRARRIRRPDRRRRRRDRCSGGIACARNASRRGRGSKSS